MNLLSQQGISYKYKVNPFAYISEMQPQSLDSTPDLFKRPMMLSMRYVCSLVLGPLLNDVYIQVN